MSGTVESARREAHLQGMTARTRSVPNIVVSTVDYERLTDLANASPLIARQSVAMTYAWSQALWDHRAFSVIEDKVSAPSVGQGKPLSLFRLIKSTSRCHRVPSGGPLGLTLSLLLYLTDYTNYFSGYRRRDI